MHVFKKEHFFWAAVCLFSVFKLWLVSGQGFFVGGDLIYDDYLFINQAAHIVDAQWLGAFNHLTLAKDPGYPLWLGFSHFLHVPGFFLQHFLYVFACVVMALSLKPLIRQPLVLTLLFLVLLFNPVSFSDVSTRAVQENIYPALSLLTLAGFMGMLLRIREGKPLLWALGAGLFFAWFWITRGEGVWLLPSILLLLAASLWELGFQRKLLLLFLPFLFVLASTLTISTINKQHYGIFAVTEFKRSEFLEAYGSLARIQDEDWQQFVPVTQKQLALAYKVSPAMAELQPFLEGGLGEKWKNVSANFSGRSLPGEIEGGWFMWALREGVAEAGHYSEGPEAMAFYEKIASEIDAACEAQTIPCRAKKASMRPPLTSQNLKPFLKSFSQGAKFLIRFEGLTAHSKESRGDEMAMKLYSQFMRPNLPVDADAFKLKVLESVGRLHQLFVPMFFLLSLPLGVFWIFKKRKSALFFIVCALFLALLARLAILALIDSTSFAAINIRYFSPLYPLITLGLFLTLFAFFEAENAEKKGRKNGLNS